MKLILALLQVLPLALKLAIQFTDPKKRDEAIKVYLNKKVIEDVKQAKTLMFHTDDFIAWITINMALKDKRQKSKLSWYLKVYKARKRSFLI